MPYVKVKVRKSLERFPPDSAGELNYKLTLEIIAYIETHGLSYRICNDIVGALDNCKDEFRRRIQHPYEDIKIEENGDVYKEVLDEKRR